MLKRLLSSILVLGLFVSLPLSTFANNTSTPPNKEVDLAAINQNVRVTVEAFLEHAVTALTYRHGSEVMRAEVVDNWVNKGELKNLKANITQEEIARVLIRALGVEKAEKSLADYKKSANNLGLFKDISKDKRITPKDLELIFNNYKDVKNKAINDKGVQEISVEDFMKNPGNFGYQLSPDGNYISYASSWESRSNVFVKEMNSDNEPVRVTSSKDRDIAGFFWKDDNILYLKDNGGDENYHIYSSSFKGGRRKI